MSSITLMYKPYTKVNFSSEDQVLLLKWRTSPSLVSATDLINSEKSLSVTDLIKKSVADSKYIGKSAILIRD